nr:MAG TPA: hypothetical protein [Caudoviricetes sp.]
MVAVRGRLLTSPHPLEKSKPWETVEKVSIFAELKI